MMIVDLELRIMMSPVLKKIEESPFPPGADGLPGLSMKVM